MKQPQTEGRPGLAKLKSDIDKSRKMVRKAAPVTVENKGMAELQEIGEELYQKAQADKRKAKRSILSRLIIKA